MANRNNLLSGMGHTYIMILAVAFAICLFAGPGIASSAVTFTPRISIRYSFNSNVYAVDPEYIDPGTATYLDYLAGAVFSVREGKNTFEVSGDVGYEQFLTLGGFFDDFDPDLSNTDTDERVKPSDYDYVTGQAGIKYRYAGRVVTFEFSDNFSRSRDLQRVFGLANDALGYWALSTHNVAMASVRVSPSPRWRNMFNVYYDTLVFDDQEELNLFELSDSVELRGLYRGEYDFSSKTTGILDVQYANRTFDNLDAINATDYNLMQALTGLRFNFRERTYLEVLGGYAMRQFYETTDDGFTMVVGGEEVYKDWADLEDTGDVVGRISLVSTQPKRYNFELAAERGLSLYGTDLFFVYNGLVGNARIYLTPKVSFKAAGSYRQAIYDIESNDREWLWSEDRVDNIMLGSLALQWDILERNGEGTVSLEGGINYQVRDSNVDEPNDYPNITYTGFWSYDTEIMVYYGQVTVKPTILFGDR